MPNSRFPATLLRQSFYPPFHLIHKTHSLGTTTSPALRLIKPPLLSHLLSTASLKRNVDSPKMTRLRHTRRMHSQPSIVLAIHAARNTVATTSQTVMILGSVAHTIVLGRNRIYQRRRRTRGSVRAKRRPTILTPQMKRKGTIRT